MRTRETASPFLRWAGSKRWLVDEIRARTPSRYQRYFEPFLGSGAIFFASGPRSAVLSDTIEPLVDCYRAVKDDPDAVHAVLAGWDVDSATYYRVRSSELNGSADRAAKFIYLNKTAFNGLYRVNRSGEFNVPYGRPKSNVIVTREVLRAASDSLAFASLLTCDFEMALENVAAEDFVYLDPPYVAGHRTNGFVDYNKSLFSWADQQRLRSLVEELDRRGAYVLLSNADHPAIATLYSNYERIELTRHSSMAARASSRGASSELLVVGDTLREVLR